MRKEVNISSRNAPPQDVRQSIRSGNLRMKNRIVKDLSRNIEHIEPELDLCQFADISDLCE